MCRSFRVDSVWFSMCAEERRASTNRDLPSCHADAPTSQSSFTVLFAGVELRKGERRGSPGQNRQEASNQPERSADPPQRRDTRFPSPCPAADRGASRRQCRMSRSRDLKDAVLPMEKALHLLRNRRSASETYGHASRSFGAVGHSQGTTDRGDGVGIACLGTQANQPAVEAEVVPPTRRELTVARPRGELRAALVGRRDQAECVDHQRGTIEVSVGQLAFEGVDLVGDAVSIDDDLVELHDSLS